MATSKWFRVAGTVTTDEGFRSQPASLNPVTREVTIWPLWGGAFTATGTEAATFSASGFVGVRR